MPRPDRVLWVDFSEVKQRVSIKQVLAAWQAPGIKERGAKLVGPCPVHRGSNPNAFNVDTEKNVWHCFTKCSGGGNVLDLVVKRDGCTVREAALWLQQQFLGPVQAAPGHPPATPASSPATSTSPITIAAPIVTLVEPPAAVPVATPPSPISPRPVRHARTTTKTVNAPLSFRLNLMADHPYLEARWLAPGTARYFGLGYCGKGIMKGRIAIPIHNPAGELIAYAGRRLNDPHESAQEAGNPKYRFPAEFQKSLVLYNLHRARIASTERVIVVEGFFAVFALYAAGIGNVVALMGSSLSETQSDLLLGFRHVTLLFDGDAAGSACTNAVRDVLKGRVGLRVVRLKDGKQPDQLSPEELRVLIKPT